jgi:hypothetical protein
MCPPLIVGAKHVEFRGMSQANGSVVEVLHVYNHGMSHAVLSKMPRLNPSDV